MEELMIKIKNVKKKYKLGEIGGTTLRDELQRFHAKIHKKPDPTKRIGAKDYNKGETFMALNGVSFEVKKGERVGIIGHNGAGKSTLLKLISRVTAPTEGTISLNGRVTSMLEVGTGFHAELTGRENVYMNGAILGMTKKEIDKKIDQIIEFSEVAQFIDTPVKRYSSGMFVKLAFSVAAHLDSEIMIMDEVLAVGDMAFQKKCIDKMNQVSKDEGKTILYVSHNMNTIRELCDRVVVLDHGKVVFDGDIEEGIDKYLNVESYSLKVHYNFDGQKRSTLDRGVDFIVHNLDILGVKIARIDSSKKIKFSADVEAKKYLNDMRIRIEVRTVGGNNIGMSESLPLFSINENERKQILFEFDVSNISCGMYCLRFTFIQKDKASGNYQAYDETTEKIQIEIIEGFKGVIWMQKYWGNVKLNPVELIKEN